MTGPSEQSRRRLFLSLGAIIGLVLAIGAWSSTGPAAKPRAKLPEPNGFDDLARAGTLIRGPWPNQGDLAKADLEEVRRFLITNEPAFEAARLGLGRECVASFEDSQAGLVKLMEEAGQVRAVSRLFLAQSRVFEADGRLVDASKSCRESLALGQAIMQGGMIINVQMGSVIQELALRNLNPIRDRLPIDECRAILRDLEALDRRRVTPEAVGERRDAWYAESFTPIQRGMLGLSGIASKGAADERSLAKTSLDRIGRSMRFFQVGLAIHVYHLERKIWPRSVADLVPDYLPAIPTDPATGQPIDYPKNPDGELTDDLGAIGRPDGAVAPPRP